MTAGTGSVRRARWIVAAAVIAAAAAVYWLREVFGPLLVALAVAYVLEPIVGALVRRGWSRRGAVCGVFAVAFVAAAALSALVAGQGLALAAAVAEGRWIDGLERRIPELLQQLPPWLHDLLARAGEPGSMARLVEPSVELVGALVAGAAAWFAAVGSAALTAVYLFYLMLELPVLWRFVRERLPAADRERTLRVLATVHAGMAAFLRGRVVIALAKGALTALGLLLCGTEAAVFLGLGAGILSILPVIGPVLGLLAAVLVTIVGQPGVWPLVWVAVVFAIAEVVENFVLTPWVMGEGVDLHPLTVLFCVLFWGAAFGVFGALCAIPLTLVLKIVLAEYVLPQVERLAASD